jgi:hypothetical protein
MLIESQNHMVTNRQLSTTLVLQYTVQCLGLFDFYLIVVWSYGIKT